MPMTHPVEIKEVESIPLAVVRRRAKLSELSTVVPEACGAVWNFVRAAEIKPRGRNVALYLDDEIDLEVGVEVAGPFASDGTVVLSMTPAGPVATAIHMGPYNRLHETHMAVRQWCADNHHEIAGPNWEIYGHWNNDPNKLQTDVYYLLRQSPGLALSPA
jgi:effector-binding domain-containing protein